MYRVYTVIENLSPFVKWILCCIVLPFFPISAGPLWPIPLLRWFISSSVAISWCRLCRCKLATRPTSLATLWARATPPFLASSSLGKLARYVICHVMAGLGVRLSCDEWWKYVICHVMTGWGAWLSCDEWWKYVIVMWWLRCVHVIVLWWLIEICDCHVMTDWGMWLSCDGWLRYVIVMWWLIETCDCHVMTLKYVVVMWRLIEMCDCHNVSLPQGVLCCFVHVSIVRCPHGMPLCYGPMSYSLARKSLSLCEGSSYSGRILNFLCGGIFGSLFGR